LPYVEKGDIILIGATTENPSFEVIAACFPVRGVCAAGIDSGEIVTLLQRALTDGSGDSAIWRSLAPAALLEQIGIFANGDARSAYNTLEPRWPRLRRMNSPKQRFQDAIQRKVLLYDKSGEEHYT